MIYFRELFKELFNFLNLATLAFSRVLMHNVVVYYLLVIGGQNDEH